MNRLEEIAAKAVVAYANGLLKINDYVEKKTGHDYMQELGGRLIGQEKKEEKERQEHWGRWALKKLAKSTVSGIFGGYMGSK